MSIALLLTKTATVKRMTPDATYTQKKTYQTAGTIKVAVPQPITLSTETIGAGIPANLYATYSAADADVKETDELTIDSKVYKVQEIQNWESPHVSFKKLVIVKNF